MPGTATITGKVGIGTTMSAQVFNGVNSFKIDTTPSILTLELDSGRTLQVDIAADTTITCTKSGNSYTLTIS